MEEPITSVTKTLTSLLQIPSNRACADCRSTLVDSSQVYASFSPNLSSPRSRFNYFHLNHERFAPPGYNNSLNLVSEDPPIDPSLQAATNIGCHGVFVCTPCAAAHKLLGNAIATVRAVQDAQAWTLADVEQLATAGGNQRAATVLEAYMPASFERPRAEANVADRLVFCRAKYQALAFVLPRSGPLAPRAWRSIVNRHTEWKGLWGTDIEDLLHISDLHIQSQSLHMLPGAGPSSKQLQQRRQQQPRSELPNRLVDYFCVVTASEFLDPKLSSLSTISSPQDLLVVPTVTDCFPEPDAYSDTEFPQHIATLVFPDGCRLRTAPEPPALFTFCLTTGSGDRLFAAVLRLYDDARDADCLQGILQKSGLAIDSTWSDDVVLFPKCLIVLSHFAFFDLWRKFLLQIYRIALVEAPLPIERFIANFVAEVPLPPPGKIQVKFGFTVNDMWLIERPPPNRLPLVNFSYRPLFSCLSVANVLVVFACLLEERRVVLCSQHYALLCPVAEALVSLLFPFHWQGMYLPVVPDHLSEVLEAPVPYLVGIHAKYLEETPRGLWPKGVVWVDLDQDQVHLAYGDDGTPQNTPPLPERQALKLRNKLLESVLNVYLPVESSTLKNRQGGVITTGDGEVLVTRDAYATAIPEPYGSAFPGTTASRHGSWHGAAVAAPSTLRRKDVLNRTDRAYGDNELLSPITGFLSEHGHMYGKDASSPSGQATTKEKMSRFRFRKPSKGSFATEVDNDATVEENVFDMHDPPGFNSSEIRSAFLRFFVSLFKTYRYFIAENGSFRRLEFVASLSLSVRCSDFMHTLLKTQMFDCFLRERHDFADDDEVRLFDGFINAKMNRSKKAALTHIGRAYKRDTSFLEDTSGQITDTYTPPPPSNWSLPDDGRSYQYSSFPRLEKDLFGKIRKPRAWPRSKTHSGLHNFRQASRLVRDKEQDAMSKAMAPVIKTHKAVAAATKRGVQRLEHAISTLSAPFIPPKSDPSGARDVASPVSDITMGSSMEIGQDLLQHAEGVVLNARRKQAILVGILIRFQAHCRAYLAKKCVERKRVKAAKAGSHTSSSNAQQQDTRLREAKRARKAARIIQAWSRKVSSRRKFLLLKDTATRIAARIRARSVRLSYLLLRRAISKFQAVFYGVMVRKKLSVVIAERVEVYRHCIFLLWRQSFTPISYRTKLWPIMEKPSFLVLSLALSELFRLWVLQGKEEPVLVDAAALDDVDEAMRLAASLGLSNDHYWKAKKYIRKHGAAAELKEGYVTPPPNSREAAERLQVYERLSIPKAVKPDELSLYSQMFAIPRNQKKTAFAKSIWQTYKTAFISATFTVQLFPELRCASDIAFTEPSKKGLRRIHSTNPMPGLLAPDMQAHSRLSDLVHRNVVEVAHLGLTVLPTITRLWKDDTLLRINRDTVGMMRGRGMDDKGDFRLSLMSEKLSSHLGALAHTNGLDRADTPGITFKEIKSDSVLSDDAYPSDTHKEENVAELSGAKFREDENAEELPGDQFGEENSTSLENPIQVPLPGENFWEDSSDD